MFALLDAANLSQIQELVRPGGRRIRPYLRIGVDPSEKEVRTMARLIVSLACALSLLLAPSLAVGSGDSSHHRSLVGTWLVTIDFPGFDSFRYLWTFTADGNSVAPLPLLGPGYEDTRAGCVGPWKSTGKRSYQLTLYCLDSQELEGTWRSSTGDASASRSPRIGVPGLTRASSSSGGLGTRRTTCIWVLG